MNPISLRYILVIVIAISQILGGVSCCCVGRTVAEALIGPPGGISLEIVKGSFSDSEGWQIGTCPKCRARRAAEATNFESQIANFDNRNQIGIDDQCRCIKLAIKATISKEPAPRELDVQEFAYFTPAAASAPCLRTAAERFRFNNEIPVRFGGHSWQAIACIWKI